MAASRGHQGFLKIYRKGKDVKVARVVSAEANQDSDFLRNWYVGAAVAEGDQVQLGWSGTIECEVSDAELDNLIDAIITQNLSGVGIEDVVLVLGESYNDGQASTYAYSDMQLRMSKRIAGATEKITKRLDWASQIRTRL
jgi:hypothetical protein